MHKNLGDDNAIEPPEPNDGNIYGAADRFYVSQKYVLERIYLYMSFVPENFLDNQEIEVQICEDDNNYPGDPITTQVFSLNTNASQGSLYNISLLNDCISTEAEKYYWTGFCCTAISLSCRIRFCNVVVKVP